MQPSGVIRAVENPPSERHQGTVDDKHERQIPHHDDRTVTTKNAPATTTSRPIKMFEKGKATAAATIASSVKNVAGGNPARTQRE